MKEIQNLKCLLEYFDNNATKTFRQHYIQGLFRCEDQTIDCRPNAHLNFHSWPSGCPLLAALRAGHQLGKYLLESCGRHQ